VADRTAQGAVARAAVLAGFLRWRVLVSPPAPGADNMALDHALLRRAATEREAILRVYSWCAPTLSLGRHQPARGLYDPHALRLAGIDVVRRPTGGRAVLHYREVTYSVTAPLPTDYPGGVRLRTREVYAAINQLLVAGLRRLGAAVELADPPRTASGGAYAPRPSGMPCFDTATPGEVVARGRKLAGSAQWREGEAILQHGSILIADDQRLLSDLGQSGPVAPVATLQELLGHEPTVDAVADALRAALDATLALSDRPPSTPFDSDPQTNAATAVLRVHYADDAWTWRR
jgi:lipoyl(octanoyl) transferase